ncbi:hypothetical protein A3B05_01570 [Candidatus Giovannonibacteria bacterium RIFCSPLOWO2_01_FULL_43_160]|uniref:Uncharacterized protein n=1 Tax=Candidatus Giovannonibacteria bacterium RIFCSPLOWO2_12_FULL_43_26 TaxID=1798363 RepID=A0A1F5XXQ1_9BACT|nr:MAG: hypothetical protein UV72_C0003G0003 [Candidatus Giovannonibacteria bacterium GW2011_GWB1_43_13]KKS99246.1 MAG: hypothetical protein UV75_C0007G0003 [Candidatus Giovannonibacteria bacterium GW2011_GWA1_43_15]KKT21232.1 MAG: hypothetical protein UW05_C0014G0002 [Candidatus Giovannonibacteria bacterium GW2011_GWC2_43_8]OGF71900.1 MAG: hypothetical protein A3E35_00590 [Candidatus Giovannonibacteria bacterium RIFCSPHIGHO2_12_FULL_44_22]OGF75288.1 MAG: hypothetical protein A3B05_01570 [Candi
MSVEKDRSINQISNWRDFALGYIGATCVCADAYLKRDPKDPGFPYEAVAFIPAFWNFKHALELGIKSLFPFTKNKLWEHDLINNLEKYKEEKGLNDKECRELKIMCEKYGKLEPLQKLDDVKSKNFIPPVDFENQFFHYPEGNKSHNIIYDANNNFAYYLFRTGNNEKIMHKLMEELKEDAYSFAQILGKHIGI